MAESQQDWLEELPEERYPLLTVPSCEGDSESFEKARTEKKVKHQPILDYIRSNGKIANDKVLKRIHIGPKYAKHFQKLCTINAINSSLAVWKNKSRTISYHFSYLTCNYN